MKVSYTMAKVLTQLSSEQSSDNEEIIKLFPKCRPRVAGNDVNQNRVLLDESHESTASSEDNVVYADKTNDNYKDEYRQSVSPIGENGTGISRDKEENQDATMNDDTAEDPSVVSGYDCDDISSEKNCQSGSHTELNYDNSIVYNPDLDIGYHLSDTQQEIAVRESRIEIAGGREIFCKSRSKPSKKRHSDEVVYHPPEYYDVSPEEVKRHSGEVLYEDKFVQYVYGLQQHTRGSKFDNRDDNSKSHFEPKSLKAHKHEGRSRNGPYSARKAPLSKAFVSVNEKTQEHTLSSGHLVYETPVRNAEVVYDDIGELVNQSTSEDMDDGCKISRATNKHVSDKLVTESSLGLQETHLIGSNTGRSSPEQKKSVENVNPSPFEPYILEGTKFVTQSQTKMKTTSNVCAENINVASESPSEKQSYTRVIGNVPIAEYEGSPRRYGPRPGYPQRLNMDGPPSLSATSPTEEAYIQTTEILKNDINSKSSCADFLKQGHNGLDIYASVNNQHYYIANKYDSEHSYPQSDNQDADEERGIVDKGLHHEMNESDFSELDYRLYRMSSGSSYVGQRLAQSSDAVCEDSPKRMEVRYPTEFSPNVTIVKEKLVDESSNEVSVYLPNEHELMLLHERVHQHTLQVEMAEHDRESLSTFPGTEDLGETEIGEQVDNTKNFTLSPETTDCDSNEVESEMSFEGSLNSSGHLLSSMPILEDGLSSGHSSEGEERPAIHLGGDDDQNEVWQSGKKSVNEANPTLMLMKKQINEIEQEIAKRVQKSDHSQKIKVEEYLRKHAVPHHYQLPEVELGYFDSLDKSSQDVVDSANNSDHSCRCSPEVPNAKRESVSDVIREIKQAIQHSKSIHLKNTLSDNSENANQPIWIPRMTQTKTIHLDDGTEIINERPPEEECDTDQETDRLLGAQRSEGFFDDKEKETSGKKKSSSKEVLIHEPAVLIEGVLFRARYLGSTQLVCEGQPTKATRMMQAEEAVSRIKAPEGETQPSTEVDLFISTEKIMVLNTDLKEIMMDHALRTISYIADIGDLVVLMARRRMLSPEDAADLKHKHTPKMICHVFESEEAQFIAQSIGQAFQVAYMEFLKANGIEDSSFVKEMDYQEVLNSQEIFGNELEMFAKKDRQKEVIVPKQKGEILGMVIVESGWGSMLPTVVIANMAQSGPAARCGQLNIGDQIIAINGVSLVGLPLSTCQNYIKNTKNQTVVKLTVVPCAPVVEVKIKRPDTKYQLGFSVQNGVICSLLRGGIAERGGVRVGHRIIEINGQSVVAVPHEKIVNLLATSVGEINMKTMPTSMFRLLTGQESPMYI